MWRNGGEISATSATFATCHFYISRECIFLKKSFRVPKIVPKISWANLAVYNLLAKY